MNSTDKHILTADECLNLVSKALKPSRFQHTKNVAKEAVRLALKYGADPEKAELAAILHDIARNLPQEEMNQYVEKIGLDRRRYLDNKNLAHSKVGAYIIKNELGIDDSEILDAVSYHTTGRSGMSLLEQIIFLADAMEPGRSYPGVQRLRELTDIDLDEACEYSLRSTIDHVKSANVYLDPDTAEALEYFERKNKKHE
ncbi:MAG: bis(5'-nucleosyl)-tetraphosphatase (symmetrical) YqeK [Bacillota bacterium]|nr:bis(5'-nucleosyl)-tetraphosphatase (symmetrical) YqeK [Bacillota bacterium]